MRGEGKGGYTYIWRERENDGRETSESDEVTRRANCSLSTNPSSSTKVEM